MDRLVQNRHGAFARSLQHITDHPLLPPVLRATALFTELDAISTGLLADGALQATGLTGFRGGSDERQRAYFGLLAEMRLLNRIALSLDQAVFPGMREQFRMPGSRSYANITAQARAFATNAAAQEAIFTDRGLPAGFVAAFTARVDAAEAAIGVRNTGLLNRAGATAGLAAKGRRGTAILRELDAIMAVALRNDPVLFASWTTARRIARRAPVAAVAPPAGGGGGSTPPPSSGS